MAFAEDIAAEYQSCALELLWDHRSFGGVVTASFNLPDVANVTVRFDRIEDDSWRVGFTAEALAPETRLVYSAFRMFNGVFQAVEEFLATRQPESVVFVAKDEDLAGIYETYLRRNRQDVVRLGYRMEGPVRVDPYVEWILTRSNREPGDRGLNSLS